MSERGPKKEPTPSEKVTPIQEIKERVPILATLSIPLAISSRTFRSEMVR